MWTVGLTVETELRSLISPANCARGLETNLNFFSGGVYLTIGSLKPRPNDRNISTQHIASCNMLGAFGDPVASRCDMLGNLLVLAIVWLELANSESTMLRYVVF